MQADIMAAKFVCGKPYACLALTPSKVKEVAKPEKEFYLFDISKADQIFDCLVKDKQIKLPEDHKIPPAIKIKGKKYCKWHRSWTHYQQLHYFPKFHSEGFKGKKDQVG